MITGDFTADVLLGSAPLEVTFTYTIIYGAVDHVLWVFGDGTEELGYNNTISHTYSTYGTHTVLLKFYESSGGSVYVIKKADYINLAKIDFSADVLKGPSPLTVQFTDTSIAPSGHSLTNWEWDFGDGSDVSTQQNPSHVYEIDGNFNVKLSADLA